MKPAKRRIASRIDVLSGRATARKSYTSARDITGRDEPRRMDKPQAAGVCGAKFTSWPRPARLAGTEERGVAADGDQLGKARPARKAAGGICG